MGSVGPWQAINCDDDIPVWGQVVSFLQSTQASHHSECQEADGFCYVNAVGYVAMDFKDSFAAWKPPAHAPSPSHPASSILPPPKTIMAGNTASGGLDSRNDKQSALASKASGGTLPTPAVIDGVAAADADDRTEAKPRILIIDFDVHHGNGSQAIFFKDPDTLVVNIHRVGL